MEDIQLLLDQDGVIARLKQLQQTRLRLRILRKRLKLLYHIRDAETIL